MNETKSAPRSLYLLLGLLALAAGALAWMTTASVQKENQRLSEDLRWYETNYLVRSGSSLVSSNNYINYRLASFDGGRNWYATSMDDSGTKVIGPAETVYPGLLAHLAAWAKIYSAVDKRGSGLSLTNTEDLKLLTAAGFGIKTNAEDKP